jgi:alkyl sulfatase BDS1-like metallo-beta-lactamase superfamily hydrolase
MKEPKEYFDFLVNNFKPALAGNFEVTVQYVLENESNEKELWWLKISDKKLSVGRDRLGEKPLVKIKMKRTHFLDIINGRTHPVKLLTTGKMFLEGNPMTLLRMDKCFKETGVVYD